MRLLIRHEDANAPFEVVVLEEIPSAYRVRQGNTRPYWIEKADILSQEILPDLTPDEEKLDLALHRLNTGAAMETEEAKLIVELVDRLKAQVKRMQTLDDQLFEK